MIENNRGYKNKSLQSWAVSYRGKQCLPHQRSLEMLASRLIPISLWLFRGDCGSVLLNTYDPKVSLTQNVVKFGLFSSFSFVYSETRENKPAIRVRSFDLFQI